MKVAAWVAAALGWLALSLLLACGLLVTAMGGRPMPSRAGNHAPRRAASSFPGEKFRVAVLGDVQKGLKNFENVLHAVRGEKADLILQTGDLVSHNDEGHYRLAALFLERGHLEVPFLVVPGNHDVDGGTERFERELGDTEYAFTRGRVKFIIVDNAQKGPPDLVRLEREAAAARPGDAVILAMHVPPFDGEGRPRPGYGPFLEWLEKSGVRYLLCGHLHGYSRRKIGGTELIVNGLGGDYGGEKRKVIATVLDVDGTSIVERRIEIPPELGLVENWEHFAIGHVAEAYRAHGFLCWAGTVLLAVLTGAALFMRVPAGPDRRGERGTG